MITIHYTPSQINMWAVRMCRIRNHLTRSFLAHLSFIECVNLNESIVKRERGNNSFHGICLMNFVDLKLWRFKLYGLHDYADFMHNFHDFSRTIPMHCDLIGAFVKLPWFFYTKNCNFVIYNAETPIIESTANLSAKKMWGKHVNSRNWPANLRDSLLGVIDFVSKAPLLCMEFLSHYRMRIHSTSIANATSLSFGHYLWYLGTGKIRIFDKKKYIFCSNN